MKKVVIILGLLGAAGILVIVLAIVGVFFMTGGLTETADAFFAEVAAGDIDGAWDHLSPDFHASTSKEQFAMFLETSGLAQYQSATWNSRRIQNNTGELVGSVRTAGGTIPLRITFTRADGGWKIQLIEKPAAGVAG